MMIKKIKEHPFFWSAVFSILIVFLINADTGTTLLLVYFFVGMFWLLGKAIKVAMQKVTSKTAAAKTPQRNEHSTQRTRQGLSVTLPPPPGQINGCSLSYNYQNIFVNTMDKTVFNLPGVEVGQAVTFYRDHNHYDESAVAVLLDGCIIGYLHDSKIRNMARGWLKEDRPIFAQISYVNPGERNGLKINIAFYK